jgi:uncharacterized protein YbaP (TraB family)
MYQNQRSRRRGNSLRQRCQRAMHAATTRPWSRSLRRGALAAVMALNCTGAWAAELAGPGVIWRLRQGAGWVYVAGSMHGLPATRRALPATYGRAYAAAARLVMEIDLKSTSPAELAEELLRRGLQDGGGTLSADLGPQRWRQLQPLLKSAGLTPELAEPLKPWAVALMLASGQLLRSGYGGENGVEAQLQARAAADRKPVTGLETASFQLGLLAGLPLSDQLALLDQAIAEQEPLPRRLNELETAWRLGDLATLERLALANDGSTPGVRAVLLDRRNSHWLPPIESFLQQLDNTLVVVGAAHLLGNGGLIALLRRRGLVVERVLEEGRLPPAAPAGAGPATLAP